MKTKKLLRIAFISLFAAIICIGSFLRLPLGPVPIVLQNALCILTAMIFGGIYGCLPTVVFLLAGLVGLPVYSGGTSGISVWVGPTGGFLPGYLIGAAFAGIISGKSSVTEKKPSWKVILKLIIAAFVGMMILYIPGLIHFAFWAKKVGGVPADKSTFVYTMSACFVPYIPGDLVKIFVIVPVALKARPLLAQYLYDEKKSDGKK